MERKENVDDNLIVLFSTYQVQDYPELVKSQCTVLRHVSDSDADGLLEAHKNHKARTTSSGYHKKGNAATDTSRGGERMNHHSTDILGMACRAGSGLCFALALIHLAIGITQGHPLNHMLGIGTMAVAFAVW